MHGGNDENEQFQKVDWIINVDNRDVPWNAFACPVLYCALLNVGLEPLSVHLSSNSRYTFPRVVNASDG